MKKKAIAIVIATLLILPLLLSSIGSMTAFARIMNVEKTGSLTIHKFLNPDVTPPEKGGAGFEGDGTAGTTIPSAGANQGANGQTLPLPGAEFSVYGRLTEAELAQLLNTGQEYDPIDPKPLDTLKVKNFIAGKTPAYQGVTNAQGQIVFNNIPINTVDLADNIYLVVETKTPKSDADGHPIVQQPSMPVLVNVPATNPAQDTPNNEVNNYIYDVNLFMKNFAQQEPGISKEIDKPTHHSTGGEEIKYTLTIQPLAYDMHEFLELEVTDVLDKQLDFYELGTVTFHRAGTSDATLTFAPGTDYTVTAPNKNTNGTIKWVFTQAGIKKLTGIQAGDNSNIKLKFTAVTNANAKPNTAVPNDTTLDFVNKWGYGTKPQEPDPGNPDPKIPTAPKPSEVVNTIFGERAFEKVDKQNNTIKLQDAEFIVRNKSVNPITALNEANQMVTYPAGTMLYAIIDKTTYGSPQVIGWTDNLQAVIKNVQDNRIGGSKYTIVSSDTGKFSIKGLEYTNKVTYRKQYIFAVMKRMTINGTLIEVVDKYEYVTAAKRTPNTAQAEIDTEINGILAQHPGDADGNGAWKFYKESEADPARLGTTSPEQMIDYLGDQWNDYELIEVRAPNGYAPIEKIDYSKNPPMKADPETEEDPFEHPFKFTVPGFSAEGLPNYNTQETEVPVPNAKIPRIPITGGMGTLIFLISGAIIVGAAFFLRRLKDRAEA